MFLCIDNKTSLSNKIRDDVRAQAFEFLTSKRVTSRQARQASLFGAVR